VPAISLDLEGAGAIFRLHAAAAPCAIQETGCSGFGYAGSVPSETVFAGLSPTSVDETGSTFEGLVPTKLSASPEGNVAGDVHYCQDVVSGRSLCVHSRQAVACNVLTDDSTTCPMPHASAYDHHDEAAIDVQSTIVLYIASFPEHKPKQLFKEVAQVSYAQRGEFILYFDAVDRAGNHAEQVPFGVIMQDHVEPEIDLGYSSTTLESCDDINPDHTRGMNRMEWQVPHLANTPNDNYDGDVSDRLVITVVPDAELSGGCDTSTRTFNMTTPIILDTFCLGGYEIRYAVEDWADIFGQNGVNNIANAAVHVDVVDTCPPRVVCDQEGTRFTRSRGTFGETGLITPIALAFKEAYSGDENLYMDDCAAECFEHSWSNEVSCNQHELAGPCAFFEYEHAGHTCKLFDDRAAPLFVAGASGANLLGSLAGCSDDVPVTHECGVEYEDDLGALCVDSRSSAFKIDDIIVVFKTALLPKTVYPEDSLLKSDAPPLGHYPIEYTCVDEAHNNATVETRTVEVVDTRVPNDFELFGDLTIQLLHRKVGNQHGVEALLDASLVSKCTDLCDGPVHVTTELFERNCGGNFICHDESGDEITCSGNGQEVDIDEVDFDQQDGVWAVKYTCADSSNNSVSKCRTIKVPYMPTPSPTSYPTAGPTAAPTAYPTAYPTAAPTTSPTPACVPGRFVNGALHDNDGRCDDCGHGKISTTYNAVNCDTCDNGQFAVSTATECTDCIAGQFHATTGAACSNCSAGNWSQFSKATSCVHCPAGTFQDGADWATCDDCATGSWTNGEVGYTECVAIPTPYPTAYPTASPSLSPTQAPTKACVPGFRRDATTLQCDMCDPGTYSTTLNAAGCKICPKGKHADAGQPKCLICPAGRFAKNTELSLECDNCTKGQYNLWEEHHTCYHCPPGKYQDQKAYASCEDCPTGQWTATEVGQVSCTDIPTPSPTPYPTACPTQSPTLSPTKGPTAYPTAAPTAAPTVYPTAAPTLAPTLACTPGWYLHHKMYAGGNQSCAICLAGSYSDTYNAARCKSCLTGEFSLGGAAGGATGCDECPAGKFADNSGDNHECTACAKGQYVRWKAHSMCYACPSGQYQDKEAYALCHPCLGGNWTQGKSGQTECTAIPTPYPTASPTKAPTAYPTASPTTSPTPLAPTPPPTTSPSSYPTSYPTAAPTLSPTKAPTQSPTAACTPGWYLSAYSGNCKFCIAGTYSNTYNAAKCKHCPQGEYSTDASTRCHVCPFGEMEDVDALTGGPTCTPCVNGTFDAWFQHPMCEQCPAGQYQNASEYMTCPDCLLGQWTAGKAAQLTCVDVPTVFTTASPTTTPTPYPTARPTASPTLSPSLSPTAYPTAYPTAHPTAHPTPSPTPSCTKVHKCSHSACVSFLPRGSDCDSDSGRGSGSGSGSGTIERTSCHSLHFTHSPTSLPPPPLLSPGQLRHWWRHVPTLPGRKVCGRRQLA
jgi:hypothetical protein